MIQPGGCRVQDVETFASVYTMPSGGGGGGGGGGGSKEPSSKDECVRVIVRCRPFNSKEKKEGNGRAVYVNSKEHTVEVKDCENPKLAPKRWTFDATFDENCTQRDIYDSAAAAIVDDVLEGFNGTIFAYGQTGASVHTCVPE